MGFYQKMAEDRAAGKLGGTPKYRVLQVDMLKQADREKAATIISFVQSDSDAYKLAGHDGFAYKDLDLRRRVGVVTYRGVEIALLFKREVLEMEPGPADPVPERTLRDPVGAWIQIDLLNADAVEKRKGIGDRLSAAIAQVQRLQMLWQEEKGRREKAEEEVEKGKGAKEALRGATEKIALMEAEKKATDREIEGLKRDLQKEKEARRNDKLNLVREMFPVFNTVWLAGVHNVGNQLYGIIRTQLTEALGKIGIKFVEPKTGDTFDPNSHHAVHGQPYQTGAREIGTVVQIHRVGWTLGSAVIEAADVSVGVEAKEEVKDGERERGTSKDESGTEEKVNGGVA
jgi:molecular chaperone GrpE (heat shock protein)